MQAQPGSQRIQRRSSPMQETDLGPARPSHSASASSAAGRATSGSTKSASKKKDPQSQLSQIEKSVTHLLVATKQLLETLTQWSRHQATEGEVSDVYVRLGYEFNIACRAFGSIGVSTDDLGPVPDLLRSILEETLSQDASPQSLDRFLPRIRDIIINLLHGLKKKQSKLRASRPKEGSFSEQSGPGQPARQQSMDSQASGPDRDDTTSPVQRTGSQTIVDKRSHGSVEEPDVPRRTSSILSNSKSQQAGPSAEDSSNHTSGRDSYYPPDETDSSLSSNTAQSLPVVLPEQSKGALQRISLHEEPPAPRSAPKQDALAALQRGGELERRASRRYSAYQISKHLGASPGGVPLIPTPQQTPIPNRGREVHESLHAVRQRSSFVNTQRSQRPKESASPARTPTVAVTIPEEAGSGAPGQDQGYSPVTKTPEDKLASNLAITPTSEKPKMSSTVSGPIADSLVPYDSFPSAANKENNKPATSRAPAPTNSAADEQAAEQPQFIPEQSPQPGKELTLFLQYKSRIKKIVLHGGSNDLSVPRLQLAFIEKFAWNTHNNGVDLPEIYIQDSVSGVRHELEDLSDIKDRSVLVLNVEPLDEVKRHIDEGFGGLRKVVEGMRNQLDGQQVAISQVSERQQDAAKEVARIATAPAPAPARSEVVQVNGTARSIPASDSSMGEIRSLRRDLAIIRQTFSSFTNGVQSSMAAIRSKADTVKAKAIDVAVPVLEGNTGRTYVNNGKKSLGDDSDTLVTKVDDLQDLIEDLRKDVVSRGVRPLARQLESATKDIAEATKELKKMQEFVKREKPIWTKIWEKELEMVCNDREFLTMQEELIADLEDDLEKATQTMDLVEQATKQQNLQVTSPGISGPQPNGLRSALRGVPNIDNADVDPAQAKEGVLGQVKALQPNHESRVEAIERAERARQRELENRGPDAAFKMELGSFVEEGRLKKSGGFEEAERQRRVKDEQNMRGEWDDQQRRKAERAKKRAEERARQVAAAAEEAQAGGQPDASNGDAADGADKAPQGEVSQEEEQHQEQPAEPARVDNEDPSNRRSSWLPSFLSGSA